MNRAVSRASAHLAAIVAFAIGGAAFAAELAVPPADASASPPPQAAASASPAAAAPDSHTTGAITGAVPPANQLSGAQRRGPRGLAECKRLAQQRRYRGAERRHFVQRCQLGYGRALFRRRN